MHATQFDRKVASPAPAAPMSNPHGSMKIGSSTIFKRHPLMVPILAWNAEPSARTIFAMTTFSIAGTAPQVTVHLI